MLRDSQKTNWECDVLDYSVCHCLISIFLIFLDISMKDSFYRYVTVVVKNSLQYKEYTKDSDVCFNSITFMGLEISIKGTFEDELQGVVKSGLTLYKYPLSSCI